MPDYDIQAMIARGDSDGDGQLSMAELDRMFAAPPPRSSHLRLIDSCITQLKAQGPARTCNESREEEEVVARRVASPPPTHEGYRGTSLIRKLLRL